jgi:thioredoxin reductase/Fe-S-cluster-containing hydrogenase component 2
MVKTDFLIIGGGPAGLSAAIEAGKRGVKTLIIDEGVHLGGQLLKQTHKFFGHEGFYASVRGFEIAKKLTSQLNENVSIMEQTTITGIYEDIITAYNRLEDSVFEIKADFILIAVGASERFIPFENNHLPGVYGAGAVQTLMNQFKVLPGKRVLMVGSGNIGLIVSYQLLQAGAKVKAIVEISNRVGGYDVHARKIKRLGVPILLNHTIKKAIGEDRVEGAVIVQVDSNMNPIEGTEREFAVDVICIATGLIPSIELAAMAHVKLEYIPQLGGYVPYRDNEMRTNVKNIFVAGDLAGIEEATTAMIEGKIAGLAVSRELTGVDVQSEIEKMQRELVEFRSGPFSEKVRNGLERFFTQKTMNYSTKMQENEEPVGKIRPIIECFENIPCNPCQTSCPTGAITVAENINSLPIIDYSKCIGCGICAMKCPGLAIFMIQENYLPERDLVAIPYEFLPIPEKGQKVVALDQEGHEVCEATVEKVTKSPNKTHLVYISVPEGLSKTVRAFRLPEQSESVVCRCEEISVDQIEKAIEEGYTDYEELRRYLRLGMGPCGGRTCRAIAVAILAKKTGRKIDQISLNTFRPPIMPVKFEAIVRGEMKHEK